MKIGMIEIVHPRWWNPLLWWCELTGMCVSIPWKGIVYCTRSRFLFLGLTGNFRVFQAMLVHETVHFLQFAEWKRSVLRWVWVYYTHSQYRALFESEAYLADIFIRKWAYANDSEVRTITNNIKELLYSWRYGWCGHNAVIDSKRPTEKVMRAIQELDGTVYAVKIPT